MLFFVFSEQSLMLAEQMALNYLQSWSGCLLQNYTYKITSINNIKSQMIHFAQRKQRESAYAPHQDIIGSISAVVDQMLFLIVFLHYTLKRHNVHVLFLHTVVDFCKVYIYWDWLEWWWQVISIRCHYQTGQIKIRRKRKWWQKATYLYIFD